MTVDSRFPRVAVAVGCTIAAVGILGTALASRAASHAARRAAVDRLQRESAAVATMVGTSTLAAQPLASELAADLGLRVTLIDANGVVVGDSSRTVDGLARMSNHGDRPEIVLARATGIGEALRRSTTTILEYYYVARLVPQEKAVRYVRLAMPLSTLRRNSSTGAIWIFGITSTTALLALAGWQARRLSRPVEELRRALALTRDEMTVRLRGSKSERAALSSAIDGMREGLLLVDRDRRVRLANRAARTILEISGDPTGRSLAEAIRDPAALRDVDAALDDARTTAPTLLRRPDRSFQIQVTPLLTGEELETDRALVLLFDVTRLERLEGVRRDFVANVSHELRTPLTSIKAFVETLLAGGLEDRENADRFLEIIRKHADRMDELIDDLTDLSLIETGAITLDMRRIDAGTVVDEVIERLHPLAVKRRVGIENRLARTLSIVADRRRFEQMVLNLLHNAIKFTEPGGRVIVRTGTSDLGGGAIVVADDGIGIAEDGLEKVFHRFHQEDPARSKALGGTGLGLAIVKHLMRLHGGRVSVRSELGGGSEFALDFPPA